MTNRIQVRRQTREAYIAGRQAQAREAFEHHQIRHRDARSWVCFHLNENKKWSSAYWFEAVVLYGGTLLINGDIDLMHFAYYGKHENPEQVLRWMGRSRDLNHYVREKAAIGMTLPSSAHGVIDAFDEDVWMDDAIGYVEDIITGQKLDTSQGLDLDALAIPEWLKKLLSDAEDGQLRDIIVGDPSDLPPDAWEAGIFDWGEVPSTRLIYAHEALRRLVYLLDQERT